MSITQGPSFKVNDSIAAYRFVEIVTPASDGHFLVGLANTITSLIAGIIQDDADSGASADVATHGQARLSLGASVTAGDLVGPQSATGQGITVSELTTTSMNARAIALQSGSTNATIKVLLL